MKKTVRRFSDVKITRIRSLCMFLLCFACHCAMAGNNDKIVLHMDHTYYNNAGAGVKWIVTPELAVAQGQYLRATICYDPGDGKREIIAVFPSLDKKYEQYLTISNAPGGQPVVYFSMLESGGMRMPVVEYSAPLNVKDVSDLQLYCLQNLKAILGLEQVFAATMPVPGAILSASKTVLGQEPPKQLPGFSFRVKFSVTDNQNSFVMRRNIYDDIKALPLADQLKSLMAERDKRMNLYLRQLAFLGDLNIVQSYLQLVEANISLQKAESENNKDEVQKIKNRLVVINKGIEEMLQ